jgi:secreted trypsin-like serine protease
VVALYDSAFDPSTGWFCGGTLIAHRWVLTAGHCVVEGDPFGVQPASDFKVLAGRHKLSGPGGERISLRRIVLNPNYVDSTAANDLALLELSEPSIQPIRAVIKPSQASFWEPGDPSHVAGWGGTVSQPAGCGSGPPAPPCPPQYYSDDLREVEVPVVSDSDCETAYPGVPLFSTLCAGNTPNPPGNDEGKDACQGDSGGPLEVETASGRALIGLVSGGDGCAAPGFAGTYTRVANFRTWIGNYAAFVSGTPSPLGFGKVKVGRKRFKSVTLTGTSSLPATVGQYSVSGKGFKRAGGTCTSTIESGTSCKVKIRFMPKSAKKRSGYLTVTSGKGVQYRRVKLVGTGR